MWTEPLISLLILASAWVILYVASRLRDLEKYGLEVHPLYALYRSTSLNSLIERLAKAAPGFWRIAGNMGVATSPGLTLYISYLLLMNLQRFFYAPERASPVVPIIPGVTVRFQSLPWFFLSAGFIILVHELSHGVQCVLEKIPLKSSALVFAVVTFGGAVEPDEEALESAHALSQMRVYAAGSFSNLVIGLVSLILLVLYAGRMPPSLLYLLHWTYFLSFNIALVNMLPIRPLDGWRMVKVIADSRGIPLLEKVATGSFLLLVALNLSLSLLRFGLIPL